MVVMTSVGVMISMPPRFHLCDHWARTATALRVEQADPSHLSGQALCFLWPAISKGLQRNAVSGRPDPDQDQIPAQIGLLGRWA